MQSTLGNYYHGRPTILGTGGQILVGFLGLDAPLDIRDNVYNFTHWENTSEHYWQTGLDFIAFFPFVGTLKYTDEVGTLLKYSDEAGDVLKHADDAVDAVGDVLKHTDARGFSTFDQLKDAIGSPGVGNHWHHIVEQSQIGKSGFAVEQIHNTSNIIAVDSKIHAKISGYYSTTTFDFTNGLSVRNWLAGKSFEEQYEFGLDVLRQFGVIQ